MFVLHLALVLVTLLSFSAAAPTTDECSQLTQPLAASKLHQILGRWILIEGFANNDLFNSMLEIMESTWMMVNTTADNHRLLIGQGLPVRGGPNPNQTETYRCLRPVINATLIDGKVLEIHLELAATYHRFLPTCPDCLIMHIFTKENDYEALYLFGRNTTLPASDLETFRKQATCLHFPQPAKFHYDPSKELCPM